MGEGGAVILAIMALLGPGEGWTLNKYEIQGSKLLQNVKKLANNALI